MLIRQANALVLPRETLVLRAVHRHHLHLTGRTHRYLRALACSWALNCRNQLTAFAVHLVSQIPRMVMVKGSVCSAAKRYQHLALQVLQEPCF